MSEEKAGTTSPDVSGPSSESACQDDSDLTFLKNVDKEIWKTERVYNGRSTYDAIAFKRQLTDVEWDRLLGILRKGDLMVGMFNYDYGFSIGIAIFEPGTTDFPGVVERPQPIFQMKKDHLPAAVQSLFPEKPRGHFDFTFDLFSQFTHSDKNREKLRWYGIEDKAAQERGDYDY